MSVTIIDLELLKACASVLNDCTNHRNLYREVLDVIKKEPLKPSGYIVIDLHEPHIETLYKFPFDPDNKEKHWKNIPLYKLSNYDNTRFSNVFCSQCGGKFGAGDNGFSHCADHVNMQDCDA
jgi:hypothetical protein